MTLAAVKSKTVYAKNSDLNDLSLINLDVDYDTLSHEKIMIPVATPRHSTSKESKFLWDTYAVTAKFPLPPS